MSIKCDTEECPEYCIGCVEEKKHNKRMKNFLKVKDEVKELKKDGWILECEFHSNPRRDAIVKGNKYRKVSWQTGKIGKEKEFLTCEIFLLKI